MTPITGTGARKNLFGLISQVNDDHIAAERTSLVVCLLQLHSSTHHMRGARTNQSRVTNVITEYKA
ncbi:hypothetical protein GCM10027022_18640 [Alpinimonas psychrophila]|uniref:Uncharacterized protein n=1 Tax=Alpinimonas psychrophila TaxID=748908 RepID=A0A7W3JUU2_9MICO|nr:hypothetical protein [Alpinimonas psychrophila]